MPPGREVVVIIGTAEITTLKDFVLFPAAFVALTEKLNVPAAVGVPEIAPVDVFKFNPVGRLPLATVHAIGLVPVAASVWL